MHRNNIHGVEYLSGEENGVGSHKVTIFASVEEAGIVVGQHLVIHCFALPHLRIGLVHLHDYAASPYD